MESISKGYDNVQALIAEYEKKYDKPTLEGFSMYVERVKHLAVKAYEEHMKQMTERIPK